MEANGTLTSNPSGVVSHLRQLTESNPPLILSAT